MPQRDPVRFLTNLSRYHKRNVCQKVTTDILFQMFFMCLLSVRYQIHCRKKWWPYKQSKYPDCFGKAWLAKSLTIQHSTPNSPASNSLSPIDPQGLLRIARAGSMLLTEANYFTIADKFVSLLALPWCPTHTTHEAQATTNQLYRSYKENHFKCDNVWWQQRLWNVWMLQRNGL